MCNRTEKRRRNFIHSSIKKKYMAILLLSGVITLFSVALSGISRESTLIKNRTHHNNKHTHNNSRNMYDLLDWVVCVYLSAAGTVVSVHLEHIPTGGNCGYVTFS
jgi:uncharacterized membrane protein